MFLLFRHVAVFVINQIARLGEAAVMRFPLDTDFERLTHDAPSDL